jgi:hypothetical protein
MDAAAPGITASKKPWTFIFMISKDDAAERDREYDKWLRDMFLWPFRAVDDILFTVGCYKKWLR